jgi:tetratricopeptide (TPR) repeat protein
MSIITNKSKIDYLIYFFLFITLIIYQQSILFDFVLDDEAVITKNSFVKDGIKGIPNLLDSFYWQGYWNENSGLYRPLSLILFAVIWQITPGSAWLFHLVQIIAYMYATFLLYRFLTTLLKQYTPLLPFIITLLFAIHPYHVEVVANIKSMDEILAFCFAIAATHMLLKEEKISLKALLFFLLALLSKEGAISFLAIWILMLFQFKKYSFKQVAYTLWPYLTLGSLWLAWRSYVIAKGPALISYTYHDNALLACEGWLTQKMTVISMMGTYLLKFLFPLNMAYDYSYPQIPCASFGDVSFIISALSVILLFFFAIKWFYSKPIASFGILFFFISFALTSNIFITIGATMADRFMFTPILGLLLTSAYLLFEKAGMLNKFNPAHRLNLLWAGFTIFFFILAFIQVKTWKSNETLFTQHVKIVPKSARVQFNYGTLLMQLGIAGQKDSLPKAIKHLHIAHQLDPKDQGTLINLGSSYYHSANYRTSADIFNKTLKEKYDVDVSLNLADAYYKLQMLDSAAYLYKKALNQNKWHPNTHNFYGELCFRQQKFEEAEKIFKDGIDKQASNAELWLNYGAALASQKKYDPAILAFRKAYEIDPKYNQALIFLAGCYKSLGNIALTTQYERLYLNSQKNAKP